MVKINEKRMKNEDDVTKDDFKKSADQQPLVVGSSSITKTVTIGGLTGTGGGAGVGALIGLIGGPVGAAIGAAIGGLVGAMVGGGVGYKHATS